MNRTEIIRQLVGNCKGKIVLDLGSGMVRMSEDMEAKKIITIDNDPKNKADYICDIELGFPMKDKSVHIVIAGELIEHLKNPVFFIRECNRVLVNNGILVLSTPNICSLKNRFRVLTGKMPEHCARANEDGIVTLQTHVKDFNLSFLTELLVNGGFTIEQERTNGIVSHGKNLWSSCPVSWGEVLVIKARKVK